MSSNSNSDSSSRDFWRLLAAAFLALPALLVTVATIPLLALLSAPAAWFLLDRKQKKSTTSTASKQRRQVVITGGSSGIGLAVALRAAADPEVERVVILARDKERLETARVAILGAAGSNKKSAATVVEAHSVDVSDAEAVETAISTILRDPNFRITATSDESKSILTTHLFCCAGEPHPAYHQDVTAADYARIAQINQLGSIYTASAVLRHISRGTITFCSSMCGQIGVFGYAAYAPTKFALRGYAECLSVELCNNPDLHIQVAYPPDTDTPGFAEENRRKPPETAVVSEMAGLCHPDFVARTLWREACVEHPRFSVSFNWDGWLLCQETAGFAPVTTLGEAVAQLSCLNLARWVTLFYLAEWHRLIRRYQNSHPKQQPQDDNGSATAVGSKIHNNDKQD